jgi:hypothetical protein
MTAKKIEYYHFNINYIRLPFLYILKYLIIINAGIRNQGLKYTVQFLRSNPACKIILFQLREKDFSIRFMIQSLPPFEPKTK